MTVSMGHILHCILGLFFLLVGIDAEKTHQPGGNGGSKPQDPPASRASLLPPTPSAAQADYGYFRVNITDSSIPQGYSVITVTDSLSRMINGQLLPQANWSDQSTSCRITILYLAANTKTPCPSGSKSWNVWYNNYGILTVQHLVNYETSTVGHYSDHQFVNSAPSNVSAKHLRESSGMQIFVDGPRSAREFTVCERQPVAGDVDETTNPRWDWIQGRGPLSDRSCPSYTAANQNIDLSGSSNSTGSHP